MFIDAWGRFLLRVYSGFVGLHNALELQYLIIQLVQHANQSGRLHLLEDNTVSFHYFHAQKEITPHQS